MSLSLMGWGSGSFLRTSEEVFLGGGGRIGAVCWILRVNYSSSKGWADIDAFYIGVSGAKKRLSCLFV